MAERERDKASLFRGKWIEKKEHILLFNSAQKKRERERNEGIPRSYIYIYIYIHDDDDDDDDAAPKLLFYDEQREE